jgi:hypothetical protein
MPYMLQVAIRDLQDRKALKGPKDHKAQPDRKALRVIRGLPDLREFRGHKGLRARKDQPVPYQMGVHPATQPIGTEVPGSSIATTSIIMEATLGSIPHLPKESCTSKVQPTHLNW